MLPSFFVMSHVLASDNPAKQNEWTMQNTAQRSKVHIEHCMYSRNKNDTCNLTA
jgi:hypothetical protein